MAAMRIPTQEEVTAALHEHAEKRETRDGDRWFFASPYPHTEESARHIVRYCLMMEVPVTDIVSAEAFAGLVYRIANIEQRLRD